MWYCLDCKKTVDIYTPGTCIEYIYYNSDDEDLKDPIEFETGDSLPSDADPRCRYCCAEVVWQKISSLKYNE